MSIFRNEHVFPIRVPNLAPIADEVVSRFQAQGYEVSSIPTITGGWHISLSKGGMFSAVLGMKTALNLEIEPSGAGTDAKASVGIFGRQVIPTLITTFLFWPVIVTQIWGAVRQSQLDEQAMQYIETGLKSYGAQALAATAVAPGPAASSSGFCTQCGARLQSLMRFCTECGAKL